MDWRSGTLNLLVLVADAPQHGKEFHNDADNYPGGPPAGHGDHGKTHMQRCQEAIEVLQEKGVHLAFTQVNAKATAKFESQLKKMVPDMECLLLGGSPDKLTNAVENLVLDMLDKPDSL